MKKKLKRLVMFIFYVSLSDTFCRLFCLSSLPQTEAMALSANLFAKERLCFWMCRIYGVKTEEKPAKGFFSSCNIPLVLWIHILIKHADETSLYSHQCPAHILCHLACRLGGLCHGQMVNDQIMAWSTLAKVLLEG